MAYGANIFNDSGEIVYSTDYPVYQFRGRYELNSSNNYEVNIYSESFPIVFVAPIVPGSTTEGVSSYVIEYTTNMWSIRAATSAQTTVTQVANSTGYYGSPTYTGTVYAYVFKRPDISDKDTGYGMNVFDSSGKLNFTTSMKILKITGYHDTTGAFGSTSNGSAYPPLPQVLTSGTIATNWAASCGSVGYLRTSTVQEAYWNTNGNQGLWGRAMGVGRGSTNTEVKFNPTALELYVPPTISGQYPSAEVRGDRRTLFIDTDQYTTPTFTGAQVPRNSSSSVMQVPYDGTNVKLSTEAYGFQGGTPTSVVIYNTPSYGAVSTSGTVILYTSNVGNTTNDTIYYRTFNSFGASNYTTLTVQIGNPAIVFNTTSLPAGSVGVPYSQSISVTFPNGGSTAIGTVNGFPIPPGLTVNQTLLTITGTPTTPGTYEFTMWAADYLLTPGVNFNCKVYTITIT